MDGHWVGPNLDWWSANSWCIGKGSSCLITYATLQSAYSCDKGSSSCDWSTLESKGLTEDYWSAEEHGNGCNVWEVGCYEIGSFATNPRNQNSSGELEHAWCQ